MKSKILELFESISSSISINPDTDYRSMCSTREELNSKAWRRTAIQMKDAIESYEKAYPEIKIGIESKTRGSSSCC